MHGFCTIPDMFLTNPTKEELRTLDLATLTEMLNVQTLVYTRLINEEGLTGRAQAQKELVISIQEAIESGREKEKRHTSASGQNR